ncbi:MAG: lamin tail domain-containing protein [Planctomycetes bacterium]|nr:lamin tail domain-containing protein [Planctomycetota bacterium]
MSHSVRLSTVLSSVFALVGLAQAQVVINEVYYDAPGGDDAQVFVELYGPAGFDVSGYTIQGTEGTTASQGNNGQSFTFPSGTLIPNDGFLVVADSDSSGATLVANADFTDPNMDLENGPDCVQLLDPMGNLVDVVAYGAITNLTNSSNGLANLEGSPARDFFAPLCIERCPAGSDTNDNAADFRPNEPTPGYGENCCTAIEYVSMGSGNSLSASAGNMVGIDLFFDDCAAGGLYITLASIVDPAVVPPPAPFPVFDAVGTPIFLTLINLPPLVNWSGLLDARGEILNTALIDFTGVTFTVPSTFSMWVGGIALDPAFNILATNTAVFTINP